MEELIKRLERVIQTGVPDKDGRHPISAETVLEVVNELSEHGTNLAEVGTDCISREQVIKAIEEEWDGCCSEYPATQIIYDTTEAIERIPAIQPKRGKWIEIEAFDDSRYVKCDQCKTVQVFYYGKRNTNFCPHCGADMRGKQDG